MDWASNHISRNAAREPSPSADNLMYIKNLLISGLSSLLLSISGSASAGSTQERFVRLAELEIDPGQLESFRSAIEEGIETAIRVEPGVLVLYAVYEKDHPCRVRVFEMYTDAHAYQTHLETPHFKKFRDATNKMVISKTLLDAVPIILGAKANIAPSSN